jgi:catechol 2,3-dioxygenase-like lactoylglutathione lyase family enzyme
MLKGLNHITVSVSDLDRSWQFYVDVLGFVPRARWAKGVYLSLGELWLCLSLDDHCRSGMSSEYTHTAFSVAPADFAAMVERLNRLNVPTWKVNVSEGDSHYFLDPDGHKLELHVGDLDSRLESIRARPYDGLVLFD